MSTPSNPIVHRKSIQPPAIDGSLAAADHAPTSPESWLRSQQLIESEVKRIADSAVTVERHRAASQLASGRHKVRLLWTALLISLGAHLIIPSYLITVMHQPEKVALMDGTESLIIAPLVPVEQSREILESISYWAAKSFLDRGPQGFDSTEILQRVFLPPAFEKAKKDFETVASEFSKKSIHQKLEIGRLDLQRIDNATILAHIVGQLLTQAEIDGEQITQSQPVSLNLKLVRNPFLGRNRRYPFAVADYNFGPPEQLAVQTIEKK